jgi:CheY-like chemotaxis protein
LREQYEREQVVRAEAERANRMKDEFLAILSHELRSPLNPILGWAKLLQTRTFDPTKTRAALATIERNAQLQAQLIDDLLDVARILRGKLNMEIAPVDLSYVIEAAIDTVRTAAVAKNIVLNPLLPRIGKVSGDATRLQQIVWNLLSNAVKFTPPEGRVDIWLEQIGSEVQLTVQDSGKGIRREFLPHLFESFRQEDASTTRQHGGLGLGLAIVRYLVEAHGGRIWADSPGEGEGATFTVRLPLLDLEPERSPAPSIAPEQLDLSGISVLAVDDEPDARDLLTTLLQAYGAQVQTLASAAEVLEQLASFHPHVLISDIGMPGMDGYQLIRQIRRLPAEAGGQVPAIALTAYARQDDSHYALSCGFQRHIAKPLDPAMLASSIMELLQERHAEA